MGGSSSKKKDESIIPADAKSMEDFGYHWVQGSFSLDEKSLSSLFLPLRSVPDRTFPVLDAGSDPHDYIIRMKPISGGTKTHRFVASS